MIAVMLPPANLHAGPPVLMGSAATNVRSALCWTYVAHDCAESRQYILLGKTILYTCKRQKSRYFPIVLCDWFFCFRSEFLERHAESLSTPVISLNTVMAWARSVPMTSMSWTACPVKEILHTAMRADARPMISSANISLLQVHSIQRLL